MRTLAKLLQKGLYCITFRDFCGGLDFFIMMAEKIIPRRFWLPREERRTDFEKFYSGAGWEHCVWRRLCQGISGLLCQEIWSQCAAGQRQPFQPGKWCLGRDNQQSAWRREADCGVFRCSAGAAEVQLTPCEVEALDKTLNTISMSAVFGGTAVKSR